MDLSVTYEGPRLEELLERVQRELGSGATIVEANRRRRGGIAGFFATEWFEVVATADADAVSAAAGPVPEPEDPPPARSVAASAPPPVRRSTRPAASDTDDPLMALVAAVNAAERPRESEVEDAGAPPVPTAETVRANARALLALAPRHGFRAESTPTGPQVDDEPEVVADPPRPTAPRIVRGEALAPLLARLEARIRPAPWPARPTVVAVVGDLAAARSVAASLAPRFGVDPDGVVVATQITPAEVPRWMRIDDPATAATRAASWRDRHRSAVVAVELVPGADGHAAAAAVLAALAPDQVRLVVPAWRDPTELDVKSAALGGLDVVDLVELDQASDPEAFLDGHLPVGSLDGRPASPELWAATLLAARSARRG